MSPRSIGGIFVLRLMLYNLPMPKNNPTKTPAPQKDSLVAENSKLTLTIPWDKVKVEYDKSLRHIAQNLKADGFRKGKVPPAMAESMVDQNHILEHTLEHVLPPAYSETIKAAKKVPISQPHIEPVQMEKGKDWIFTVYFAEQPDVKLGDYTKAVSNAKKDADKEIAETIKNAKKDDKPLTAHQKEDIQIKHIFKHLVESVKPKVPELLIRQEVNRELQRLSDQLQQLKLSADDFLKSRQMTLEQLRQEYAASALTTLQLEFILAAIAKESKTTVEDKEVDEMLDKVGNGTLSKEQKQNQEYRSYVFSTLLKQKVMTHLLRVS